LIAQLDGNLIRSRPWRAITRLVSYSLFEGRPLTTRGRWINPAVFGFLKTLKHIPVIDHGPAPLFIIGTGRSGTTVLGQILGLHRQVGFLNEPKAMWHVINQEEDIVGNYTEVPARYRLEAEDANSRMIEDAQRLYGWYKYFGLCSLVVDKYPELVFRISYVLRLFPGARFIFLVRNGWDTCFSIDNWSDQHAQHEALETHDWWGRNRRKWLYLVEQVASSDEQLSDYVEELHTLKDHRLMAAVEWVLSMSEGLKHMVEYPENIQMVRYEDLVNDPVSTLQTLFSFARLSEDRKVVAYASEILRTTGKRPAFPMPDHLRSRFDAVMSQLGYVGDI